MGTDKLVLRPSILIVDDDRAWAETCQGIIEGVAPQVTVVTAFDLLSADKLFNDLLGLVLGVIDREVLGDTERVNELCEAFAQRQIPYFRVSAEPNLVAPQFVGRGVVSKQCSVEMIRSSVTAVLGSCH